MNLNGRLDKLVKAYARKCTSAVPYLTEDEVHLLISLNKRHGVAVAVFLPEAVRIINEATRRTVRPI